MKYYILISEEAMGTISIFGKNKLHIWIPLIYFVAAVLLHLRFTSFFKITAYESWIVGIAGIVLIGAGVLFYLYTLKTINRENNSKFITKGTFSICRNPIYASWIWFFIPGAGLSVNSWGIISTSLILYLIVIKNIKKSEAEKEKLYGEVYVEYKNSVNRIFPVRKWRDENDTI